MGSVTSVIMSSAIILYNSALYIYIIYNRYCARWVDYRLRVVYKLDVIFVAWKSADLVKTILIFLNTVDFERLITEAPGCSWVHA